MSVEMWRNAELFYEFWLVILGLLLLLGVIILIFITSYAKKDLKGKAVRITLGIMAVLSGIGLYGHAKYHPYLDYAKYSNPLIRDREPRLHIYLPYSSIKQAAYTRLNYLEPLREMVLYEEERVIEPVRYLGQGDVAHYFKRQDGELFSHSRQIQFTETAERAQLVGSRFSLKDAAFKELGFINPKNIMVEFIEVPSNEEGKIYTPDAGHRIQRADNVFHHWNFPN